MENLVFIDVETRGAADLRKVGAQRYTLDPETDILFFYCLYYSNGKEIIEYWEPGLPIPNIIYSNNIRLIAFNAEFEIAVFENILAQRYGFPKIRDENWQCVMSDCLALALPGKLDMTAEALQHLGVRYRKDPAGKKLIDKFSKKGKKGFLDLNKFPAEKEAFKSYCLMDVKVERDIYFVLPYRATEHGLERKYYLDTVKMNKAGVPICLPEVQKINAVIGTYSDKLNERLYQLTGKEIATAGQRDKILNYLWRLGVPLPDLTAPTVRDTLLRSDIDPKAKEILQIRATIGRASIKKYKKMLLCVCPDGTIKNNHIYHKASTGRDAGVNTQFQNLAHQRKAIAKNPDAAIQLIENEALVNFTYGGDPIDLAKDLIRSVLKVEKEEKFICADFKGVEARGTAWTCLETERVQFFLDGFDIYKVTAADIYGLAYEDIGDKSDERQSGKIVELSGGYQGGWRATLKMARQNNVNLGLVKAKKLFTIPSRETIFSYLLEEAKRQKRQDTKIKDYAQKEYIVATYEKEIASKILSFIGLVNSPLDLDKFCASIDLDLGRAKATEDNQAYRRSRPKLVAAWANFQAAAGEALQKPGVFVEVPQTKPAGFYFDSNFLYSRLPSGRFLSYPFPEFREVKFGTKIVKDELAEDDEDFLEETNIVRSITAMTMTPNGKWLRQCLYGGKFFQNYIQALCRDLLFHGLANAAKHGYISRLRVHDEGNVIAQNTDAFSLEKFIELITNKPEWALDFPLAASGWEGPRYKKD